MGKSRYGDKEYSREQKLIFENKRLKKKISQLQKALSRIDLDRYSYVKDILDDHYAEEDNQEKDKVLGSLKEAWRCRQCHDGFLEITIYSKINELWYYRRCNKCENRTKSQRYDKDKVQGIIKKNKDEE